MLLNGKQLAAAMTAPDVKHRLVISPLLEPRMQIREDQASVDIRLGFHFAISTPSTLGAIDEIPHVGEFNATDTWESIFAKEFVPFGKSVVIHPQKFMLASTLEYFRLPDNLGAYVIGRSSWGRLGLIVATATGVQPRFAGLLTLELRNLGESPIVLYPGQMIAQLFFHSIEAVSSGAPGQYTAATEILPRNLSSPLTRKKSKECAGI